MVIFKMFHQRFQKEEVYVGIQANLLLKTPTYFLVTQVIYLFASVKRMFIYLLDR